MISTDQIRAMLLDTENDRVERTISTTNTDKFGQAICAFANDLPCHQMPGYLFLGVRDDGSIQGLEVTDASINDMDQQVFKHYYLPKAIPDEVNDNDKRSIKEKMQALGFYDMKYDCPTFAGILFFGKNPERFLGGAYVQYVRFGGNGRAGKIMTEHKFSGNLCKILDELDTFIKTTIANRRPIPVSALREDYFVDYPYWATRELVMNAICHRDYTGNGPVQFYQYDDRIEILNPGGLYGKANSLNFPRVNDYRNPVLAEGMRVLGYVNRYSWGVLEVQERLEENGNGLPEFDLGLVTAFLVKERISPRGMEAKQNAIEQGFIVKENGLNNNQKGSDMNFFNDNQTQKRSELTISKFPTMLIQNVYEFLKLNKKSQYSTIADNLGISESSVKRAIAWLKENGYINPNRSKIKGEWQLL